MKSAGAPSAGMVYSVGGSAPGARLDAMSDLIAGRYRPVAPLPPIGGVKRELAIDQVADHRVAVARVKAGDRVDAVDRHLRGVQAVRHSCLAPVLDVTLAEDRRVVHVEAQADGPLLAAAMLSQTSSLLVAADIADALAALHAAGQVHGGLAADAVVLDATGRPVVMGAGLAGARAIADGALPDAPAGDMRALGAILYLLVTGGAPASPPVAPLTLVAGIPPALNGLMLALLSDDPRRPPPPAAATADRLRAMVGAELPASVRPAPLPVPPQPTVPRRGVSDAAIAAIVGGIALLAIVLAVAAVKGGDLGGGDSGADTGIPTFTLPAADSLTLTLPATDTLPLPGVVTTDTTALPTDTATVPTETLEVFTETTATVPPVTDTGGGSTLEAPQATLQIG